MKHTARKVWPCALWLLVFQSSLSLASGDVLQGFDAEVEATMRAMQVPNAAVGAVRDGKVVFAKGYGVRELGKDALVDADTIFPIASITKSFTTAVMASQVDEGKLAWDQPIREYLPWFQMFDPVATELITARDLASHRSGLPRHDFIRQSTYLQRAELVRRIRYLPPNQSFREGYQYNNLMYVTAGYLSGVLAESSWEQLVHDRIFVPLGMNRSNTATKDSVRQGNYVAAHGWPDWPEGQLRVVPFYDYQQFGIGPNGAVNSTVHDLLKYAQMYLDGGKAADGKQVLSAQQLEELFRPVVPVRQPETQIINADTTYALGWFRSSYRGELMLSHSGVIDSFRSQLILLPKRKLAVVVLNGGLAERIAVRLTDRLLGVAEPGYLDSLPKPPELPPPTKAPKPSPRVKPVVSNPPSLPLSAYAGNWFHPAFGTIRVDVADQGLNLHFDALDLALVHDSHDTFRVTTQRREQLWAQFITDRSGKVTELRLPLEPEVAPFSFTRR
ncbi:serine hydrolase [Steroidobacter sp.]|uniref:serine hydrolase n=1 Tax=Steroidobacter sp. TaxID=1978227 RepID=UPI001A426029|nr:serine hydrolase [Steroidobacter sp.]MBL8271141.1 serine hydrolase [Steroidobacter sp.]